MKAKSSLKTAKPAFDTEKMLESFIKAQIRELGTEDGALYARRCFEEWAASHAYDFCLDSLKRALTPVLLGHVSDLATERANARHRLAKRVAGAYLDGWSAFFGDAALTPIRAKLGLPDSGVDAASDFAPSR